MANFIVLEGTDGCGKSTQSKLLAADLNAALTHEPGDTALGAKIRELLLAASDGDDIDDRAEALLMAADRAQHVATVIRPALDAGQHVICDRYVHSSVAYQGAGRNLGADEVFAISEFATCGLLPDLTLLFLDPDRVARQRVMTRGELDRMELQASEFHDRVTAAYADMATSTRYGPLEVIDPVGTIDEVYSRVRAAVRTHLDI